MNRKAGKTERRKRKFSHIVGVFNGEGPPVPIPNTEVKLTGVDNTWLATARADRLLPDYTSPLALNAEGLFLWNLKQKRNITIYKIFIIGKIDSVVWIFLI